jgi:hypothetical protein
LRNGLKDIDAYWLHSGPKPEPTAPAAPRFVLDRDPAARHFL